MCFCFFFQAEDGIRDGRETGVQTCALPISASCRALVHVLASMRARARQWIRTVLLSPRPLEGRRSDHSGKMVETSLAAASAKKSMAARVGPHSGRTRD